ncbi:MAG: hypothetical protein ABIK61_00640 [candidate division WOR-3 bacterium]
MINVLFVFILMRTLRLFRVAIEPLIFLRFLWNFSIFGGTFRNLIIVAR